VREVLRCRIIADVEEQEKKNEKLKKSDFLNKQEKISDFESENADLRRKITDKQMVSEITGADACCAEVLFIGNE
jgi:hypothetical protein